MHAKGRSHHDDDQGRLSLRRSQVHGDRVVRIGEDSNREADAACTRLTGQVCAVGNTGTATFSLPSGSFFLVVSGNKQVLRMAVVRN